MQFDNNVRIYQDVFFPPNGYEIEWAELATWSLSKDWLRMIAAMIAAGNSGAARALLMRPNSYIKADKERTPRFHVFYDGKYQLEQEGSVYCQTANGRFSAYLFEKCCTPVMVKNGLFHPKYILMQFKKREGEERCFRLFVSSRNLTWSSYVETGVILESNGELPEPYVNSPGQAMAKFLENYYTINNREMPERLKVDELRKAHFRVITNDGKVIDRKPLLFWGKQGKLIDGMKSSFTQWKAQFPNYHDYFLRISSMNPTIQGLFDIENTTYQYICNFKDMYEKNPKKTNTWKCKKSMEKIAWYLSEDKEKDGNNGKNPVPLHSKHYMFWGWKEGAVSPLLIWLGSANCSKNGLEGKNEEMLLRFCVNGAIESFPGVKCLTGADYGKRYQSAEKIYFRRSDVVNDPKVSDLEDEEELKDKWIAVVVDYATYNQEKKVLSVTLSNKEENPVYVWPVTCSEADTSIKIEGKKTESGQFCLGKNKFSRLLHLRRENEDRVYTILLELKDQDGNTDTTWYGKNYEEKKSILPPDPLKELGDLIPNQVFFSADDNVFEKLLKCKCNMEEEEFVSLVNMTKAMLSIEKAAIETMKKADELRSSEEQSIDADEVEEDELDNELYGKIRQIFDREKEYNAFIDLLEKLGGQYGTDRVAEEDERPCT